MDGVFASSMPPSRPALRTLRGVGTVALALIVGLTLAVGLAPGAGARQAAAAQVPDVPDLTLVTLEGPGTAGLSGGRGLSAQRARLMAQQQSVLEAAGVRAPVYRWTTALNGFAARLTPEQVRQVSVDPAVALVEPNKVLSLAEAPTTVAAADIPGATRPDKGGAGTVVGVVDTGLAPESPVFADVPNLGRDPREFAGACATGESWTADTCNRKVVGARWFVSGFGRDRVRSSETLSPRDVLGHGTKVASVAAGNAAVTVSLPGRRPGAFSGMAPQARIATYKACWAAPDPADDGCATADLVTAIDRAVGDGVDVLNLSVSGGSGIDTVQLALLGAAEDDVVVIGASGNDDREWAAHPAPWVTTVGPAVGDLPRATITAAGGPTFEGTGRPRPVRGVAVLARSARATGVAPSAAARCLPGTLDVRAVAGKVVVCERGGIARVEKSRVVSQADGSAMILLNRRPGSTSADFHSVPTVHLGARSSRELKRWIRRHHSPRVNLRPSSEQSPQPRSPAWAPNGNPRSHVLKPDVVAGAGGLLAAQPESGGRAWGLLTGSSAAAAQASGLAARLVGRHDWPAARVRAVLATTATPITGASVLLQGSGVLGADVPSTHLSLDIDPRRWRTALRKRSVDDLNLTSLMLTPQQRSAVRHVTNIGPRAEYFSVQANGFEDHDVQVRPLAVRLAPGESASFTISVTGPETPGRLDDGFVVWRGARGGHTRIPVAITR